MKTLLALAAVICAGCRGPADARVAVPGGDPEQGRVLIETYGCGTCHTIPDVPNAHGLAGPPLFGIADRGYIGGVLPNTPDAMVRWLQDPRAVTPRTVMPNVGATESEVRHIAAYLFTLRAESRLTRMLRGFLERMMGRQVPDPAGAVSAIPPSAADASSI